MGSLRSLAALAAFSIGAASFAATPTTRYRVAQVPDLPTASAACLPGYARRSFAAGINDLGVVAGNFRCYSAADPANNLFTSVFKPYIAAPHFGAYELELPPDNVSSTIQNINNRLQTFGAYSSTDGGFYGLRWNLGSGPERVFSTQQNCEFITNFNYAAAGNARGYVVGWIFQQDASLPPPLDTFCLSIGWAIRTPNGTQVLGPLNGIPSDINALDVAAGYVGNAGIRLHVPTGRQTVLNAGTDRRPIMPSDINDLGEVVGYANAPPPEVATVTCGPSVGLRWERDGRERTLNNLPGAISSRAWSAGYEGETVGESGPGDYCNSNIDIENERAVLWKGVQAFNLNALIPASERITLIYAVEVNRRGQIVAGGYRNDEAPLSCPDYRVNPDTGGYELDPTLVCRNIYAYVLTPTGR
ncbi:MAG: hypothetical protein ABI821_11555 [Pseudomonadota bacterium]